MSVNNGGTAFPARVDFYGGDLLTPGMTLRDYFAAKAMQGIVSYGAAETFGGLAKEAYQIAAAMLAAREAK